MIFDQNQLLGDTDCFTQNNQDIIDVMQTSTSNTASNVLLDEEIPVRHTGRGYECIGSHEGIDRFDAMSYRNCRIV